MEETDKTLNGHLRTVAIACKIVDKTIETERGDTYIPAIPLKKETEKIVPENDKTKEIRNVDLQSGTETKEQEPEYDKTTLFTHDTIEAVLKRKQAENMGEISRVAKKLREQKSDDGR